MDYSERDYIRAADAKRKRADANVGPLLLFGRIFC